MTRSDSSARQAAIRIVVADDHEIVRDGLRLMAETASDLEVVGEAADGVEAVEAAARLRPDVVLMDLRMPRMDGLAALRKLRTAAPSTKVVILTTYDDDDAMLEGFRAGARGFLLKDANRQTLAGTIRAAARGESLFTDERLDRILAAAERRGDPQTSPRLTEREREVLRAAATGERSKEIAYRLSISERTVKAHLSSVYAKLEVDSRAAAVATAARLGLLDDAEPAIEEA
ncbi:MAG: response regulator [Spirochaetota bacterium]